MIFLSLILMESTLVVYFYDLQCKTGFMLYIVVTKTLFKRCWNVPWCVALSWRTTLRPTTQTSSLYSQLKVFVSSFNGHVTCTITRARRSLRGTRVCVFPANHMWNLNNLKTVCLSPSFLPSVQPISTPLSLCLSALSSFCSPLMHFLISAD